jgi:hypothetical protein
MKHLQHFKIINESNNSREKIESELNSIIEKYGQLFANIDNIRERILKQAEENGYRGNVKIRKSPNDPKAKNPNRYYIVYEPGETALQAMGSAAGRVRRNENNNIKSQD